MIVQRGRLEQAGSPTDILDEPATEFVARFVGDVNVFEGESRDGVVWVGPIQVPMLPPVAAGSKVHVVVRSYDLKFWKATADGVATVRRMTPLGDRVRVEASTDAGILFFALFPRRSSLLKGVEPGGRIDIEVTHARAWSA